MYINLYAIIAGLFGVLFIVTKMRHPHIKHVRESLEGSILFKLINVLDFYTGNHALFYDEIFPEIPTSNRTQPRDPFHFPVPSICPCAQLASPHVDSYYLPKKLPRAGAYQILPALCATAGVFFFSTIYLRKSLRHALREDQRNVMIHAIQVERHASQPQDANVPLPTSNTDVSQDTLFPSSSVSVVTRQNDPIFYPNAGSIVVAQPMPIAISNPLLWTDSPQETLSQSPQSPTAQNGPAIPLTTDFSPLSSSTSVIQVDDDLPYLIPLPQDEPELDTAKEFSGVSTAPPSRIKPDVDAISYFTSLPFAQDLDTWHSTMPTPTPSPGGDICSPRILRHIAEPSTPSRPSYTPQVSCRRPDWLSSAQYWEAHSRLNALVSNTAAGIETTPDSDATQTEALVVSPDDYKIRVPRVRATTSLAQPMTVSGSAYWEHMGAATNAPDVAHFVTGRTGADLVLAMSTSMPRVIDMRVKSGDRSQWSDRGEWAGASGRISSIAEMSASPRATSILRQVAADAAQAPLGSNRRRKSVTAAVLQTPWLNRTGVHDGGGGTLPPATATATRSTGISPIQTAVQSGVIRRVLGPHRRSSAGHPSERWTGLAESVERPPVRITRVFGEPAAS